MGIDQSWTKRKETGARYKAFRKGRLSDLGSLPALTKLGDRRALVKRGRGANRKISLLSENTANVLDPKTKKYSKAKIKTIVENPANRHFIRRNIMTKGCVIDTEKGKARVTSRPGQDGTVNAVLI